jgi:hypothetical protein
MQRDLKVPSIEKRFSLASAQVNKQTHTHKPELQGSRGCTGCAYDHFDIVEKVAWPVKRQLQDDIGIVSLGWLC